MTPERWKQIEEVFQTALDLPASERRSYVAEACGTDEELRRQVEALVAQYEEAGDFIEEPAVALTGVVPDAVGTDDDDPHQTAPMTGPFVDPAIGRRVGSYRLVREIGRGGMGTVYLAERADAAFRLRVAVKLIKRGMDTDFILRRFRNERQILATLDHPNIARLLDGGTTDDDLPYFVMEYIEGLPVYRYCDEQRLSTPERLRLFCQICDAVHYAHRQLVIHRDIKPSNILVTPDGTPKLLDFGIAKVLNPELVADITADPTATAMRLMTPEYASPEQVQGLAATPATDVYSLGVLLYELLTGHRPYRLRQRAPHEVARVICEDEPLEPSAVLTRVEDLLPLPQSNGGDHPALEQLYRSRSATAEVLRHELTGDLDNIVMKALRKEPERRYHTAEQLREDIQRHLEGRPVSAAPHLPALRVSRELPPMPSRVYDTGGEETSIAILPLKMFEARHDDTGDQYLGVGLADALITRLGSLRRFALRPTSSVLRFGALDTDPLAAGRELNVSYVLDGRVQRAGDAIRVTLQLLDVRTGSTEWAGRFDEKFTDVLSLEDAISEQVAEAIVPQLTGGERLRLHKRATDDPRAHEAYMRGRYHWSTFTEEGLAKALTFYHQAVALDPSYALAHAGIADYYNWLGVYAVLPFAETSAAAVESALKAVALDPALAEGHSALAFARLTRDFDWGLAEQDNRRALELNPNYATGHGWYSYQLMMEGRFDESLSEVRRALELDPLSAINVHTMSWCHYNWRRYDEAIPLARKLVAIEPRNGIGHLFLGHVLAMAGVREEAINESLQATELFGRSPYALSWHAMLYGRLGEMHKAREVIREIEGLAEQRYVSPYLLALAHCNIGDTERAFELLERAYAVRDAWLLWLGVEPQLDPLRSDPRFGELLRRTNNPTASRFAQTIPAPSVVQRSIAVLPLKLIGQAAADGADDYLGVGLADALVTRLSAVRRLIVRPTSSVQRFRNGDTDPLRAGRELGADYVIDGNIRRAGDRIRVTAQLLSVAEGSTRWAGHFDEPVTDVLQLEDTFSEQVADAIIPQLTSEERRRLGKRATDVPEAYEAYLRGRYHWNSFTEDGFAKALVCYNRAIAVDPNYALAYAGIADYYNLLGVYAVLPFAETSAAAKEAALKAVALDDGLAEGFAALGLATLCQDFDWAAAERYLRRAVEINPNYATGRLWYCYYLGLSGRQDEALAHVRRAAELDPVTPIVGHAQAWAYFYARRFEESAAAARELAAREARYGMAQIFLCLVMLQTGRHEEAIAAGTSAAELLGRSPYTLVWLATALAVAGRAGEARALLEEIRQLSATRFVSPYLLAMLHLRLGERTEALTELERALEVRDARLLWLGVDPQFDSLRTEPRVLALLRRTGNPAAETLQLAAPPTRINTGESSAAGSPTPAQETPAAEPPRPTENEEAYQLYVAGRYYSTRRTAEGLRQGIERLAQAVERDPNFSLAYSELADCYALLNWYVEPPPPDAWERAKQAAERAVAADDQLAEAHASLGFVMLHYERDWPAAVTEFRRALELKPGNPAAHRWYAYTLSAMGRHDDAISEIERARELLPRSPVMATAVANVLFLARRFDEAVEQCRRALELDPGSVAAHVVLRWAFERKGLKDEALAAFEQERVFAGDTPTTRAKRAHVLAAIGRRDEAREILRELLARRDDEWVTAYEIAVVHSLLGELEEALRWLAEAEREHAVGFTFIRVDPHLDDLRPDPRFQMLAERTGNLAPAGPAQIEPDDDRSIAVLPLKIFNPERGEATGDDYLGIGLADALITRLSGIRRINVRPTSAVARFREDDVDPVEAGRSLGVGFVLDGRVLRAGERLRVTVQLVRVSDRAPVWADKFDVAGTDILDVQDSISEQLAAALVPRLTEGERARVAAHGTDNVRAYEAYLRGRYHWNSMSVDGSARAIACYRDAIQLDPDFAAAHAGVADYLNWLGVYGVRPSAECFAEAKASALRAISLDPELADAYAALSFATSGMDWDWAEAERLIKKSIELNPNYATARNFYCLHLAAEGRFDEMLAEGLRGLESDPLSVHLHQSLGWGFYHARRYDEALKYLDRSLELDPNFALSRWVKGWVLSEQGRHRETMTELERVVLLSDRQSAPLLAGLAVVLARAGDEEGARRLLGEMEEMVAAGRHVSPYHFAVVHSALGDEDLALTRLEEALAAREAWLIWLKMEPKFDPVRAHTRFRAVLERVHPPAPASERPTGQS